jgi:hypothetical protein
VERSYRRWQRSLISDSEWNSRVVKVGDEVLGRISSVQSFPVSGSKYSQSRSASEVHRRMGNSRRRSSRASFQRALAISVFSLLMREGGEP